MANPTTNYGWPMPTSTDLVTDLPADFALFGQPVDTSLKALNPETTLGDIAYRSSTANTNTRLAVGSAGQVLTVTSGVPSWETPATSSSGSTKVLTASFSAVANTSTTFDGVFTSTYKNYLVVFSNMKSSATTDLLLQLRVGAVTTATNYYGSYSVVPYNTTISSTGANNATSAKILGFNSVADPGSLNLTFSGVGNSSSKALVYGNGYTFTQSAAVWLGYQQETSAIYTGFILSVASGTTTGTVTVYGLAN